MSKFIPYGRQEILDDDISAVVDVLKSPLITQGNIVPEFESRISSIVQSRFAVAVNSATSALHLSCLALGLSKDDVLWTSAISFVASANCGLYCGATVDFVDIDPLTGLLCIDSLRNKLIHASLNNCIPKILVVVHLATFSVNTR